MSPSCCLRSAVRLLVAAACAVVLGFAPPARAANTNATWLDTGTNASWNTATDWASGVAPGSTVAITGSNADTSIATFNTAVGT